MGGRGASGIGVQGRRLIGDYLQPTRKRKIKTLDQEQFGRLMEAEGQIRGRRREVALMYEDITKGPEAAFQGDEGSVAFNYFMTPNTAMTHNHPDKRHGGTFSFADMNVATVNPMSMMRAASREGTYYLKPGAKADSMGYNRRIARDIPKIERQMMGRVKDIQQRMTSGKITEAQAKNMLRTYAVGVLHRYYKDTASQYGFTYGRMKLKGGRQ